MAGVTNDGVLDTDATGGGGGNVTIVGPLGQTTAANSVPVVLASDQPSISVDILSIVPIIDVLITNPLGQTTSAASISVVLASDQSAIPVESTQYKVQLEEASATITYVGQALPGTANAAATWRIKRLDSAVGLIVSWADSVSTFTKVWNDRATYTYN